MIIKELLPLLGILSALSSCNEPNFPEGQACQMVAESGGDMAYLNCRGVANPGDSVRLPASQAFSEGYVCISPDYYADLYVYRADLTRWISKHCQ